MYSLRSSMVRSLEDSHGQLVHDENFLKANLADLTRAAQKALAEAMKLTDVHYDALDPASSVLAEAKNGGTLLFVYDLVDLVAQAFFACAKDGGVRDLGRADQAGRDITGNTVRVGDMVAVPRSSLEGYTSLDLVFVSSINDKAIATAYFDADGYGLGGSLYPGESVRLSESVLVRRVEDEEEL